MTEAKKIKSEKTVGALVAGLKVLRYMSKVEEPVGVSKVARDLSISPSTCFSLLRTLVSEDLLDFSQEQKTYTLSTGLFELAKGAMEQDHSLRVVRREMRRLSLDHRVTVMLFRRLGSDRVFLAERIDTDAALRVHMSVGQRLPMYIGALGRCFAAFGQIDRETLRERFKELRWEAPPPFEEFWSDVKDLERTGYAVDRDNFTRGITTAAAPILGANNFSLMVVSAVGFSGQFDDQKLSMLGQDLRDASAVVGEWFGR